MGINMWHNADFLAVAEIVAAKRAVEMTEAVEMAVAEEEEEEEEAAAVVAVPVAAFPFELSRHSQVSTCLHICNSTGTVNDKKSTNFRQINVYTHS